MRRGTRVGGLQQSLAAPCRGEPASLGQMVQPSRLLPGTGIGQVTLPPRNRALLTEAVSSQEEKHFA